jgi:hypothetical protein
VPVLGGQVGGGLAAAGEAGVGSCRKKELDALSATFLGRIHEGCGIVDGIADVDG